jgi:hypothetical protein
MGRKKGMLFSVTFVLLYHALRNRDITVFKDTQLITPLLSLSLPVPIGYAMSRVLGEYFGAPNIAISKYKNFELLPESLRTVVQA